IITTKNKSLCLSETKKILSNSFYFGLFKWSGEVYEGRHAPIISKQLFDKVQEVLASRNHQWINANVKKVHKQYIGLLKCGECGMAITAEVQPKYYKETNRHVLYTYYHCTKKSKIVGCTQSHYVSETNLHSQLTTLIKKYTLKKTWANQMFSKLKQEESDIAKSCLDAISIKRKDLEQIDIKLKLLLDSYLDQIIDKEEFQESKFQLMSKKKTTEEQILSLKKNQGNWIEPFKNWISVASGVDQIISTQDKQQIKVLASKIFGSDLFLENKTVRGDGINAWSALGADPTGRTWVHQSAVEPPLSRFKALSIPKVFITRADSATVAE
ncbi:MAG: Recombinase, partial [Candidatus Woesebacteria bacterium GW2011_GWC2_33_12]